MPEVATQVADYPREQRSSVEPTKTATELGSLGGVMSPEYGVVGLDREAYAMLFDEVSQMCHAVGIAMSALRRSLIAESATGIR
jgi:hypothetical protein